MATSPTTKCPARPTTIRWQTSVKRRFQNNLMLGLTWTWSKAMDYASGTANPFTDYEQWNYGKTSTDRTHVVAINYLYTLPALSRLWKNQFVKAVGDGWQISGVTFDFAAACRWGSATAWYPRRTLPEVAEPALTHGSMSRPRRPAEVGAHRSPGLQHEYDCRAGRQVRPGKRAQGRVRGLGTNNFDMELNKVFRFGHDGSKSIQFRFETYNTFNPYPVQRHRYHGAL